MENNAAKGIVFATIIAIGFWAIAYCVYFEVSL